MMTLLQTYQGAILQEFIDPQFDIVIMPLRPKSGTDFL